MGKWNSRKVFALMTPILLSVAGYFGFSEQTAQAFIEQFGGWIVATQGLVAIAYTVMEGWRDANLAKAQVAVPSPGRNLKGAKE